MDFSIWFSWDIFHRTISTLDLYEGQTLLKELSTDRWAPCGFLNLTARPSLYPVKLIEPTKYFVQHCFPIYFCLYIPFNALYQQEIWPIEQKGLKLQVTQCTSYWFLLIHVDHYNRTSGPGGKPIVYSLYCTDGNYLCVFLMNKLISEPCEARGPYSTVNTRQVCWKLSYKWILLADKVFHYYIYKDGLRQYSICNLRYVLGKRWTPVILSSLSKLYWDKNAISY